MKTITLFESAEELVNAMTLGKPVVIPSTVYLVVDGNSIDTPVTLSGDGSEMLDTTTDVNVGELLAALAKRHGFSKVHYT